MILVRCLNAALLPAKLDQKNKENYSVNYKNMCSYYLIDRFLHEICPEPPSPPHTIKYDWVHAWSKHRFQQCSPLVHIHGRFISRSIVSNGGGIDSGPPRKIRAPPYSAPTVKQEEELSCASPPSRKRRSVSASPPRRRKSRHCYSFLSPPPRRGEIAPRPRPSRRKRSDLTIAPPPLSLQPRRPLPLP